MSAPPLLRVEFPARAESLAEVRAAVNRTLLALAVDARVLARIVLAIDEAGEVVHDKTRKNEGGVKASRAFAKKVQLPSERIGTLLVFRVFDRMSYALVVGATNPIRIADVVRKP